MPGVVTVVSSRTQPVTNHPLQLQLAFSLVLYRITSLVTSASHCVTCRPQASWQSSFWRPRISKRWTSADCLVSISKPIVCLNFIRWMRLVTLFCLSFRSVREDRHNAEWQTAEKEEDQHQEVHIESVLQWVLFLWSTLRTDTGTSKNHPEWSMKS